MKNNLLLIACLFIASFAKAQFTSGQKMIGGQFFINTANSDITAPGNSQNLFNIGISPSFSKFTSPTTFRTLGLSYSYHREHVNIGSPSNDQTIYNHSIGVFAERTKLETLAKRFYFTYTGSVNAQYTFGKSTFFTPGSKTESNGIQASMSAGIGLLYQVNQRFLLTCGLNNLFSIYYIHNENKSTSGSTTYNTTSNNAGLVTGLSNLSLNSLSIGVKYLLKK